MRIAVFGAGSIGGPIAAHLIRARETVSVFAGNQEIAAALSEHGLDVYGVRGDLKVPIQATVGPAAGDGPFDVVLLAMKTERLQAAARDALPYLAPSGFLVCCQNGVPEPRAIEVAGRERVVGGVVGWGGSMEGPGRYRVTSRGTITLGEPGGAPSERIRAFVSVLQRSGLPAKTTDNLPGVRWSKLALNCTITTLGAVSGLTIGGMVSHRPYRELAFTVMSEVADVARAEGVRLEKVAGTFEIDTLYVPTTGGTGRGKWLLRHTVLRAVGVKYRRQRSGITRSLERGRRPEIDALNGFVVERGRAKGVPTPLNDALTVMVRDLAEGRRQANARVWEELLPLARR